MLLKSILYLCCTAVLMFSGIKTTASQASISVGDELVFLRKTAASCFQSGQLIITPATVKSFPNASFIKVITKNKLIHRIPLAEVYERNFAEAFHQYVQNSAYFRVRSSRSKVKQLFAAPKRSSDAASLEIYTEIDAVMPLYETSETASKKYYPTGDGTLAGEITRVGKAYNYAAYLTSEFERIYWRKRLRNLLHALQMAKANADYSLLEVDETPATIVRFATTNEAEDQNQTNKSYIILDHMK